MAMTDTARLAMLALPHYVREKIEPISRKSYLMHEIRNRGLEDYRIGGEDLRWRPRKRRAELTWGPGNPNTVTFPQMNLWGAAALDYKTCYMGASVPEIELLALQDKSARFFQKVKDIGAQCAEDFMVRFGPNLYKDGVGAQNLEGFESFGGYSSYITGEPVGNPSDTYAGLSTALGAEGDWDAPSGGGWPRVDDPDSCDYEYHYWSPLIVNYNDPALVVDSTNETMGWDDCWIYACRYLTTHLGIVQMETPDAIILEADLLRRAKNSLKKDQQFTLDATPKDLDPGIEVLKFDGITFATEFGVPASTGYAVNFKHLRLKMMGSDFIKTMEDTDIATGDKLYRLSWHGNLWCDSPAYFGFLKAVTSVGT